MSVCLTISKMSCSHGRLALFASGCRFSTAIFPEPTAECHITKAVIPYGKDPISSVLRMCFSKASSNCPGNPDSKKQTETKYDHDQNAHEKTPPRNPAPREFGGGSGQPTPVQTLAARQQPGPRTQPGERSSRRDQQLRVRR